LGYTTKDFYERKNVIEEQDFWMGGKIDFMYSNMDFLHDRAVVRDRFLNEMNKKTTL
jgi:hypothetical protein